MDIFVIHNTVGPLYQEKAYQINANHRGLEIPIKVTVSWSDKKSMIILREKVKHINCPSDVMVYVDDQKKVCEKICLGRSKKKMWKTRKYRRHQILILTKTQPSFAQYPLFSKKLKQKQSNFPE